MADNTALPSGDGLGDAIATDDIGGVKYPRSKIVLGADNSNDGDVAAGNPMPVAGNTSKDGSGTVYAFLLDTDGHLQVDVLTCALPAGAATATNQATANTALTAIQTAVELIDNAVSGNEFQVDVVTSALPTGAASSANQATANAHLANIATAVQLIDNAIAGSEMQVDIVSGSVSITGTVTVDMGANNDVQGSTAHGVAVGGNPFLQAAEGRTGEGTAVANGDVVRLMADLAGRLVNQPFAPTDAHWRGFGSKTDTTDLQLASAAGAGVKNYLTDLIVSNSSSTDTEVLIKDGSTEIARFPVPQGGVVKSLHIPLQSTANTALNAAASTAVSTLRITALGYTGR